ncbi:amino acid permease/ SLC12A domain-containing protein [Melampsora americana]|nr:amino acid permease/ SLC12A domain-containing protein [Melampsora americana]
MSDLVKEKSGEILQNEKIDVYDSIHQESHHHQDHQGEGNVKRNLKQRHISMIAIGGTIGTGLFLGSGEALSNGGPVGLILGYAIMGVIVYSMMVALGEMVTMFPVSGAFTHYAKRFVDPALGFAVGFNYWYSFGITLPTEITAAAIVVQYWTSSVNVAVWITIFLITICAINFFGVRWYGEAEFWFSAIKVIAIVGLNYPRNRGGPNRDRIGFRYWKDPGPFNQLNDIQGSLGRFLSFWSVFVQAAFSFQGTEIVALTAGEAANPRQTVPKAINRVFYRILLFYIGGVTVIGLLVPHNSPGLLGGTGDATSSPFVIAINNAGIKVLPDLVNAIILTSAYSAGNSDLYAGSRILYGLSIDRMAPKIFRRCTQGGLPVYSLIITSLFGVLSYLNVNSSGSTIFEWFSNLSSITGLITWWTIFLSYLRFHKGLAYKGIDRNTLHYKAPFQPYLSYFGITMISIIIIFNGFKVFLAGSWSISKFIAAYVSIPTFVIFFVVWKSIKRTKFVKIEEMDFETGRRELDEMDAFERSKNVKPTTVLGKFWAWLM